jgi:4-amino-4-deoxy-L-arabinose transferase-like glycosyltransferase
VTLAPGGERPRTEAFLASAAVALVWGALYLAGRWQGTLHGDALRYAAVAKNLAASGDLTDLRFAGEPYWNKPPLVFALAALSFRVLGTNRFAAGLPVALFALGTMLATGAIGRRLLGPRGGWAAAILLGTTPLFLEQGGTLRLDPPLAFFVSAAFASLLAGRERPRLLPLFGVCVGLGFLAKGPGALAPLGAALLLSLLWRERFPWNRPAFWIGLALGVAIAAPWFVAMAHRHGEAFLDRYFGAEFEGRFVGEFRRQEGPASYLVWLAKGGGEPCLLLALVAGIAMVRSPREGDRALGPFLLAWGLSVLVPLLFVRPPYARYLVPAMPVLALLGARALAPWLERSRFRLVRNAILCFAAALAGAFSTGAIRISAREPREIDRLAAVLRARGPETRVLSPGLPGSRERPPTELRACLDFSFDGKLVEEFPPAALPTREPRPSDFLVVHYRTPGTPPPSWRRIFPGSTYDAYEPAGG